MLSARRLLALLIALIAVASAVGCQSIIGIEDRTYAAASAECRDYCDSVMKTCTGENAVYASMQTCLGVCADLPPGDASNPGSDNSVACRANQLKLGNELTVVCPRAGPGGDGACGSNCDGYCAIWAKACPDDAKLVSDCVSKCAGLRVEPGFDVAANASGDSLECRLVHASAATLDPTAECQSARIASTSPCADAAGSAPSCDDYCNLVMAECQGDLAVYDSLAQCKTVCAALPPGSVDDTHQDTVGCRKYHSYNAVLDPGTHCAHAGPAGDGHCGTDNCESYCLLAKAACASDYATAFQSDSACQSACTGTDGSGKDVGYSVATADGHTVQCRIHHAVLAFSDPTECANVFGNGTSCN